VADLLAAAVADRPPERAGGQPYAPCSSYVTVNE
jgi:hypothetical protein